MGQMQRSFLLLLVAAAASATAAPANEAMLQSEKRLGATNDAMLHKSQQLHASAMTEMRDFLATFKKPEEAAAETKKPAPAELNPKQVSKVESVIAAADKQLSSADGLIAESKALVQKTSSFLALEVAGR